MPDRRRFPRFLFVGPLDGNIRTVSDCVVETWDGDRAVLLTAHPARQGETYVMQLHSSTGETSTHSVRVVSSTPVEGGGTTRFRLHLSHNAAASEARRVGVDAPSAAQRGTSH
jgi:hypothetical protein